MSKNLEEEYLREIQSDVPDLWSRINAGIDKLEESKEKEEPSKWDKAVYQRRWTE